MVTLWWSAACVIHYHFCLIIRKSTKCTEKCASSSPHWSISFDPARLHVSQITFRKLDELSVKVLPHAPYSPDLSPTDNFLTVKLSPIRTKQNRPSSSTEFLCERINQLCYVGKSTLIRMALISIKLNK